MASGGLAQFLSTYDVSVTSESLSAACADPNSPLMRWISSHVASDTLLTAPELTQYEALRNSGRAEQLACRIDDAVSQSFGKQEVENAVYELERYTAVFTRQQLALVQQQDALGRLLKASQHNVEARSDLENGRARHCDAASRSTSIVIQDLSRILEARTVHMDQQAADSERELRRVTEDMLDSDSKLLSSLQKLGRELETEDPDDQDRVAKLRELCARLIKSTVETIRAKLDRVYLDTLDQSMRSGASDNVPVADVSALESEVESLYSEILPVAQMSAEQQFLEPGLQGLNQKSGTSFVRSERAVEYIRHCLDYVVNRLDMLLARALHSRAHWSTASFLLERTRAELAASFQPGSLKVHRSLADGSPSSRRQNSWPHGRTSPARPRASSPTRLCDETPLDEMLRSLALYVPQLTAPSSRSSAREQAAFLDAKFAERRTKATDVSRNVQQSFESLAVAQMTDARVATQLLRDSVLAESPFSQVRLMDPDVQASIEVLEQESDSNRERVANCAAMSIAGERSSVRDHFIRRWGR